jgi:hypothetical protein
MSLTADQLSDLRIDLGIPDDPDVFTDAQLQRIWARVEEDKSSSTEEQQLIHLRLYTLRILRANAAKLYDYRQAASMDYQSQVFKHLDTLQKDWNAELTQGGGQVRVVGMTLVPPRRRETPNS